MPARHRWLQVCVGARVGGEKTVPIAADAFLGSELLYARAPLRSLKQVRVVLLVRPCRAVTSRGRLATVCIRQPHLVLPLLPECRSGSRPNIAIVPKKPTASRRELCTAKFAGELNRESLSAQRLALRLPTIPPENAI